MICFSQDNILVSSDDENQPDLPGMEADYDPEDPLEVAESMIDSGVSIESAYDRLLDMNFDVDLVDLGESLGKFIVYGNRIINSTGWGYEISDFIFGLSDMSLAIYMEENGYVRDEWEDVGVAYHATPLRNAEKIELKGIMPMNESRGISNRSTPSAVFMSENIDEMDTYGEALFEIDLAAMRNDGYMPTLEREEPVSESEARMSIARRLGVDDTDMYAYESWDGIAEDTLVLYGDIPRKYLKRIK